MPNISEMHLLIIFRTWSDSLAMENDLKTLENTIFCVAIPFFFYYTLGIFKHKKNTQNEKTEII